MQYFAKRTMVSALVVLLLTIVHHTYGAWLYDSPGRHHVSAVGAVSAIVLAGSFYVLRARSPGVSRAIALWIFMTVTLLVVAGIGLFEAGYGHVAKNALYFGGVSAAALQRLYPPSMFELPNDALFEITGVMQLVPALFAAYYVYRLLRERPARSPRLA
jgi:hypothetical protein